MSYSGMPPPPSSYSYKTDEKILEALRNYHVVRLEEDDKFNDKLTWCLEHCQNKFRDIRETDRRAWYFENEQDASMFALKWA